MTQLQFCILWTVADLAFTIWWITRMRKKFVQFLTSENARIMAEYKTHAGEMYKRGASDMGAAIKKQMEEAKRIQTSIPFIICTGNEVENKNRMSVAGIYWDHYKNNKVPLLEAHQWNLPPIGDAFPFVEDGVLKAVINFREDVKDIGAYGLMIPAIGGKVEESHIEDGITIIDKFSLHEVSLSVHPNQDPTIKSLNEQIKNK